MDNVCELSIEETNKLRVKLGLKKLEINDEDNSKKVGDEKPNFTNEELNGKSEKLKKKKNDDEAKKKKIIKANKIDLEEKNKIKTISEDYKDDIDDVESWINKTRNTMNKRLAQESIQYSDEEEEPKKKKKKSNFVSCVKVEHKNEDITDDMILTLKDTSVLNEEEDCLINEELKKQSMKHLISKKDDTYWNKNYYDPLSYYDDNKKNVENESSFNMIPKYKDEKYSFDIKVQYDENKEKSDKKVIKKHEFVNKENYNQEEREIKRRDERNNVDNALKLKKRKIKNIRKRKKDAWDFLYDDKGEEEKEEMEKEEKKSEKEEEEEMKQNESTEIIDDVIKKIKEEQTNMEFNYFDDVFSENEDDKELYELLQKGNNFKKIKKENNYQNELLKYIVINDEEKKLNDENNDNVIKLTNASEFCKNISLPRDLHENEKKIKSKKNEKEYMNEDFLSSKNILKENINEDILKNTYEDEEGIQNEDENQEKKGGKFDYEEDKYDEIEEGGVSKIFNEVELDEGLCGALKYLKTKGELNIEDKIYRNPENKPLHMSTEKNDIKLDYKNESGKVMTPKETFRYISWIFHGKKQGKNKLEKKIKRSEIERRFKENPMDSLPTLNVLKKYQQIQKKSYFTLSSNN